MTNQLIALPRVNQRVSRRLRVLIAVTAATVVVVETLVLLSTTDAGFAIFVRATWAALRVVGFLVLMRAVRLGRAVARPLGLVLAITTVFAVARLAAPRTGSLVPAPVVLVGLAVLTTLCAAVVTALYGSRAVQAHLSTRPALRRPTPPWVLTVRVAMLTYGALLLVPLLVALGAMFGPQRRVAWPAAVTLLAGWGALFLVVAWVAPVTSYFVARGARWARGLTGLLSVAVLIVGPLFCYALLGLDGLLRDGVPLAVTALLGLYALYRSRSRSVTGVSVTGVTDSKP